MPLGALYPSKSGLMNKHIVKHISNALLCGFCRGPLLEHRAPPVIAGRCCPSSPTLLSPALPLVGTAAGGGDVL